jgi:hypothetical protein
MPLPKANSNFFKQWSGDMAYILGFIVTDGCLIASKTCLNITNKNKKILSRIAKSMGSNHKIGTKLRGRVSKNQVFSNTNKR